MQTLLQNLFKNAMVYINASLLAPWPHSQATSASFPGQWGCENNSKTCGWVNVLGLTWDNSHQSSHTQYIGKQSLELKLLTQERCNSWVGVIKIKAAQWCVIYKWLDKDPAMFRLSNWWGTQDSHMIGTGFLSLHLVCAQGDWFSKTMNKPPTLKVSRHLHE